ETLRRARAGGGAREESRDRVRAAPARGEHLGDARPRRAARPRAAADAPTGGEADAGARVAARHRRGAAPMAFGDSPVLAPTFPPWRARFVVGLLAIAFGSLAGRAAYLQGWNRDFLQAKGESRYSRTLEIPAHRGRIFDRNGEALAVSTPVKSIWAIPEDAALPTNDLERLAAALPL